MATVVKVQRRNGVLVTPYDVYIGRAMYMGGHALPRSKWANPFKVGDPDIDDIPAAVVAYWKWLYAPERAALLAQVGELRGKTLGCWCVAKGTEPCHGWVLIYAVTGVMHPTLREFLTEVNLLPLVDKGGVDMKMNMPPGDMPVLIKAPPRRLLINMSLPPPLPPAMLDLPPLPRMGTTLPPPGEEPPPPPPVVVKVEVKPLPQVPTRVEVGRVRAGFVALALGDALGAPFEFGKKLTYTGKLEHKVKHKTNPFQPMRIFDEGSITDDTEMALVLARSLIENKSYDRKKVAEGYIKWANSGTVMIGTNTRDLFKVNATTKVDPGGLKHYEKKYIAKFSVYPEWPFTATSEAAEAAQSNGALMRCFPLACYWSNEAVERDVWASNPSSVALDCERVHIHCLRLALMGTPAKEIWEQAMTAPTIDVVKAVFPAILKGENWTLTNEEDEKGDKIKKKGWVVNSFYAAMSCLAALATDTPPTFAELMTWVIAGHPGSDTDTNAAIAGGLIGAIIGWDELIKDPTTVENIQIMLAAGDKNTSRPAKAPEDKSIDVYRPDEYRLVDIETVVQALTALSSVDSSAPPPTPTKAEPLFPRRGGGRGKKR